MRVHERRPMPWASACSAAAALVLLLSAAAAAMVAQQWVHSLVHEADGIAGDARAPSSGTAPEALRLSFGDAPGSMTVTWHTRLPAGDPCVQYEVRVPPAPPSHPASQAEKLGPAAAATGQQYRPLVGPLLPGSSSSPGDGADSSSGSSAAARRLLDGLGAGGPGGKPAAADSNGAEGGSDLLTACGTSTPFVEPSTGRVSLHVHRVALQGLPPGQAVRYRCGSTAGGWSAWRLFRSPRSPEQYSNDAPARLLIVGDMGLYNARCWPDIQAEMAGDEVAASLAAPTGGTGWAGTGAAGAAALGAAGAAESAAGEAGAAGAAQGSGGSGAAGCGACPDFARRSFAAASPGTGAADGVPPYDALLHIGDLAYDLQALEGRRASQFLGMVEPVASRLPYMVAPGNHEWHFNFSHYRSLFSMPQGQAGANLYYAFDMGPLHVLVYNTEVFFWPDLFGEAEMRAQYEWMEADLKAANAQRHRTPWILVAGHRPMYCVQATGGRCNAEHEASRLGLPSFCPHNNPQACRPLRPPGTGGAAFPVEELLTRYGVDLAVFGHVHDYERFWPVANHSLPTPPPGTTDSGGDADTGTGGAPGSSTGPGASRRAGSGGSGGTTGAAGSSLSFDRYTNPRATVHLTSGAGGNSEMRGGTGDPPQGRCGGSAPWCAFQSGFGPGPGQSYDYSYSKVTVYNATHLRWQQVSSLLGRVVDDWWVVQEAHGPFAAGPA